VIVFCNISRIKTYRLAIFFQCKWGCISSAETGREIGRYGAGGGGEERGRLHRAVSDSGFGFGAKNLCSKLPAAGIRTRIRIRIREAPMMRAAAST